jgi:hypothetical protein
MGKSSQNDWPIHFLQVGSQRFINFALGPCHPLSTCSWYALRRGSMSSAWGEPPKNQHVMGKLAVLTFHFWRIIVFPLMSWNLVNRLRCAWYHMQGHFGGWSRKTSNSSICLTYANLTMRKQTWLVGEFDPLSKMCHLPLHSQDRYLGRTGRRRFETKLFVEFCRNGHEKMYRNVCSTQIIMFIRLFLKNIYNCAIM